MRVLVAFGTRPEIIKLGPVCKALQDAGAELDVFWSGQHIELAAGLLDFFGISVTHNGSQIVEEQGLAGKFGRMTEQVEKILRAKAYDWIIVQGDTATAAAAAAAGFMGRVPVAHVEAGLRTGDLLSPFPEEFNRRLIGQASSLHFPPTQQARTNLLREGVPARDIVMAGNTVVDALLYARAKIGKDYQPLDADVAALPADKKLVLATMHRRENIGAPMHNVLRALRKLASDGDKIIALPVHLNPQVRSDVLNYLGDAPNVRLLAPLQYPDFVYLLDRAWTVVTDSGGVQEEAPTFGLQILITRESTERPEVVSAGFGQLVGSNYDAIVAGVRNLTSGSERKLLKAPNPFGRGDAAERIAARIMNKTPARRQAAAA
ncbi:MAG: non-hydrolyzing UDP-N-acetylglucosamine 2-epimerase [Hyphomicrobium sp.]|jgi:UDP-N-acetylglucosamine 2-epimerase